MLLLSALRQCPLKTGVGTLTIWKKISPHSHSPGWAQRKSWVTATENSENGGITYQGHTIFELERAKASNPQIRLREMGLWKAIIYNPKATEELSKTTNYPQSMQVNVLSPRLRGWRNTLCPLGGCTGPRLVVGTMSRGKWQFPGEMKELVLSTWAQLRPHLTGHSQGLILSFSQALSSWKERHRKKPPHAPVKPRNTLCELKAWNFPKLSPI